MASPSEVGLQLLLSPLGSNIVVRTACPSSKDFCKEGILGLYRFAFQNIESCSVGLVLPVYSTFKAVEKKDQSEQQRWLIYWAVYGSFSVVDMFAEKVISWFPLYHHMKFAFLVWLQLPTINGAGQLYLNHLRPFLLKHQARLDQVVDCMYGEMSKFISAHQAEFQLAKTLVVKVLVTANQMVRDLIHPIERQENRSIEGPKRQIQNSESEED